MFVTGSYEVLAKVYEFNTGSYELVAKGGEGDQMPHGKSFFFEVSPWLDVYFYAFCCFVTMQRKISYSSHRLFLSSQCAWTDPFVVRRKYV